MLFVHLYISLCISLVLTYVCAEAEYSLSELASDASSVMVRSTLDQMTQRSQQLQKDLADSAHLLSKYNLKSAQQVSTEAQSTTGLWYSQLELWYSYLCPMLYMPLCGH